jgi:hypothetical protein
MLITTSIILTIDYAWQKKRSKELKVIIMLYIYYNNEKWVLQKKLLMLFLYHSAISPFAIAKDF